MDNGGAAPVQDDFCASTAAASMEFDGHLPEASAVSTSYASREGVYAANAWQAPALWGVSGDTERGGGDSPSSTASGPTFRISATDKDGRLSSPSSRGRHQFGGRVGVFDTDTLPSPSHRATAKDRPAPSKLPNPLKRVQLCSQILMVALCVFTVIPFVYRVPVARHGLIFPSGDRRFLYAELSPGDPFLVPDAGPAPPGKTHFGPGVIDAEKVRAAVLDSDERARAGLVHAVAGAGADSGEPAATPESHLDDVTPSNTTGGLWGGIFAAAVREEFECDRSSPLTDVCTIRGDVRINVTSGEIVLFARNPQTPRGQRFIRPHPRKWNWGLMEGSVTQFTVQSVDYNDPNAPVMECAKRNTAPGVLFSVGGFCGGVFHDFNEVYLPLFETTHSYERDVVMLVADLKGDWWWHDAPRRSFVGAMTRHAIRLVGRGIDTESYAQGVECFDHLTLGLYQNLCMYDEFGGRESRAFARSNVKDFAPYVRKGLQMPEPPLKWVFVPNDTIPVVGIVQRMNTRKLVNYKELLEVAEKEGYKVVPITFEHLSPEQAAETMAKLDVLVGVHGAGLSNICLMRPGGVVLQIMPYGEGGARNMIGVEYKNFAAAMGAEYLEWSVPVHDSTIKDQYSHSDWIVTSPLMIWKHRGQDAMNIYHSQDVVMPEDMLAAYLRQIKRTLHLKARLAQELEAKS